MTRLLYYCIIAALFAAPAYARLGETEEQCAARYGNAATCGKGDDPQTQVCRYEAAKFTIAIWFLNGKAAFMMISKTDRSMFSKDELNLFLGANSARSVWQRSPESFGDVQKFTRSDGRATATIVKSDQLVLESVEWKAAKLGMGKF